MKRMILWEAWVVVKEPNLKNSSYVPLKKYRTPPSPVTRTIFERVQLIKNLLVNLRSFLSTILNFRVVKIYSFTTFGLKFVIQ